MIGNVKSKTSLNAIISSKSLIRGTVNSSTILGDISIGTIEIVRRDLPNYRGPFVVKPNLTVQILPTKNRSLLRDVVVHEIPYAETSNPSGGYTAIIGG